MGGAAAATELRATEVVDIQVISEIKPPSGLGNTVPVQVTGLLSAEKPTAVVQILQKPGSARPALPARPSPDMSGNHALYFWNH